jgi:NCS1 family nucleobase:cation symporter-1
MRAADLLMPGFGAVLAVSSLVTLTAAMGVNAYSGALTAITGLDSLAPVKPTRALRIGAILFVAAAWFGVSISLGGDPVGVLDAVLVILLYLLAPWTAVNLVDYFLLRKGRYAVIDLSNPEGVYGAWGARGLVGYFAGFFASVPFFLIPGVWTGPLVRGLGGVDIAWLVSLIVGAGVYLIVSLRFSIAAEVPAIAASEAALAVIDGAPMEV